MGMSFWVAEAKCLDLIAKVYVSMVTVTGNTVKAIIKRFEPQRSMLAY